MKVDRSNPTVAQGTAGARRRGSRIFPPSYRRFMPYVLRQWRGLLVIALFTVLSSAMAALQPWPLKILVDYGLGQSPLPEQLGRAVQLLGSTPTPLVLLWLGASATLVVFAFNGLIESLLTWRWTLTGQRMVASVAADVFHRLQHLPLRFHHRHPVGDSLTRLTGDCWCVYKLTDGLLMTPAHKLITLLTLGVVAWKLNASLALCALITAPLMAVATVYFGDRIRQRAHRSRKAQARLLTFVHQTLTSIPIVQAFNTEERNRRRYQDLATDAVSISQRGSLQTSAYQLVTGFITTSGLAVIVLVGGRQVLAGTLTLGSFLVFLAYMRTLQNAADGLVRLYASLKPVEASMERVLEVLDAQSDEVQDHPQAKPWPATQEGGVAVRMEGVTFGYRPGQPVLRQIDLEARPGQVVALVGSSGAGKTTLASLIPRLFDPWEGRVLVNGTDLRQIQLRELRLHVAVVLQESVLLPLTVAQNIAYGRPQASRADVESAAQAACADEFIRGLPQGYDTVIGQRGATLSGGERQRLAIARAFLMDAPILILDEPTSALDSQTEKNLLLALERLKQGRTVFVIAHRLSTVRGADQIVVLEEGRIVQRGQHAELLAAGGVYEQLHRYQTDSQLREEVPA